MIKRLSTIITGGKERAFGNRAARWAWYLAAALALLLFWLYGAEAEIAFVYNAF